MCLYFYAIDLWELRIFLGIYISFESTFLIAMHINVEVTRMMLEEKCSLVEN